MKNTFFLLGIISFVVFVLATLGGMLYVLFDKENILTQVLPKLTPVFLTGIHLLIPFVVFITWKENRNIYYKIGAVLYVVGVLTFDLEQMVDLRSKLLALFLNLQQNLFVFA